ncbi:hypothetical protein SAY86_022924 [Trapa natans]|uniref:Elongation factor 1-alpha n=1 Tax=Trapa natans TaxID=22666 RepID=A0AAN7LV07_TRANT|nr:hypothetical protein SAY86_022924 [Trapa natans]
MPRKVYVGVDYDEDDYNDYDDYYDYDDRDGAEHYGKSETPNPIKDDNKKRSWACPICTYDNEESMSACDICGVLRNPLPHTKNNHDKKTVYGMCKDSGVSKMARSLFSLLPHQTPKNVVVTLPLAAPFKFDVPSPDDIVSNGLHSSKIASKGVPTSVISKDEASTVSTTAKSSNMSSRRTKGSRTDNVIENNHLKDGEMKVPSNIKIIGSSLISKESTPTTAVSSKYCSGNEQLEGQVSAPSGRHNPVAESTSLVEEIRSHSHDQGIKNSSLHSKSQAPYKPEKWMLPEKGGSDMNQLNLAIVGHVDSGKSTLSGRLLHLLGRISQKQMHKYEKEAKQQGKGSFAYAWALDESSEERERGITMTVGVAYFDTKNYHVVVLDSPGHKDFVPNMISGATQADSAILVIDASVGSFEAGVNPTKGQTREHAQLIRSFGVDQLIVAINKMDVVEYSKDRYEMIKQQLGTFLRSCGFKDSSILWIPLSVMENQNLVSVPSDVRLQSWYKGPHLLDAIDSIQSPTRDISKPVIMPVCDVVKLQSTGQVSVIGKLEAGALRNGSKVLIMPSGVVGTVKSLERDSRPCTVARAGDNVGVVLQGIEDIHVMSGDVICHTDYPVPVSNHFELKILVLDGSTPILIGSQLEFHVHHTKEAAKIVKITSLLDPKTGKPTKKAPRCLVGKQSAILEVVLDGSICAGEYSSCKALGRVSLRSLGRTVAVGVITRLIED